MPTERHRELDSVKRISGHARFVELCALFTSGSLEPNELEELDSHLAYCEECRAALAGYYDVVRGAVPLLLAGQKMEEQKSFRWNQAKAKKQLFAHLEKGCDDAHLGSWRAQISRGMLSAAGTSRYLILGILCISIGVAGYMAGTKQQHLSPQQSAQKPTELSVAVEFDRLANQRDQLRAKVTERDALIAKLSAKVASQTDEILRLQKAVAEADAAKSVQTANLTTLRQENKSVLMDRDAVSQKLQESAASLSELRQNLSGLESERIADLVQMANLQKRIEELTNQASSSKATVAEQQKMLASDRDIRELMGARDLYIADVFDIDHDGNTRKPFGRVFYTKNKSLIFYAFDLDKQPDLKNANTFQAWGERSSDKQRPVNLGIFYVDNEANRRWVLKFDNPNVMKQINAVFVTLEPAGGSGKPSGKQLLYAYLPTQPNHP